MLEHVPLTNVAGFTPSLPLLLFLKERLTFAFCDLTGSSMMPLLFEPRVEWFLKPRRVFMSGVLWQSSQYMFLSSFWRFQGFSLYSHMCFSWREFAFRLARVV